MKIREVIYLLKKIKLNIILFLFFQRKQFDRALRGQDLRSIRATPRTIITPAINPMRIASVGLI